MTCREFKRAAAGLGLQQATRAQDPEMAAHATGCPRCEGWMQEQQMLAAAMKTLSLRTAACGAGGDVEQALLRAFRQSTPERPTQPVRFPSFAMRMSRWFEMGAYGAIAAALMVGLFLAYRVWQHPATLPVQSQNAAAVSAPVGNNLSQPQPIVVAAGTAAGAAENETDRPGPANAVRRTHFVRPAAVARQDTTDDTLARADYVNLMFCDPLSCSSDEQVVRMELPVAGSSDAQGGQPVVADVVIGDDGLVRAMRIVN